MKDSRFQILLTNDDGIQSPALWAAAEALAPLGYITVAAPREQSSGAGRSLPKTSDGRIERRMLTIHGQEWETYAVGGTPAQAVLHALLEIMPTPPDLVVSGINYGENVGTVISLSGTVGAALEAASFGIPAIAASLEIADTRKNETYSREIDFSVAAYFTAYFAELMLKKKLLQDVDVLKIDVPSDATRQTPWLITKNARHPYYDMSAERKGSWDSPAMLHGTRAELHAAELDPRSDVYAMRFEKKVSVTPLSLDMTSRVNLGELENLLRQP